MRYPTGLSLVWILLGSGCDEPAGIRTIHVALSPPHGAIPPELADVVSPLDARLASGTVDVMVEMDHVMSSFDGLPVPADPAYDYALWIASNEPAATAEEDRESGPIALAEGDAPGEYQGRRAFRGGGAYDVTFTFEDDDGTAVTETFRLNVIVH